MVDDPIVAEVRAARGRLAARFDYDLEAIFRHIQAEEARSGLTYVPCPPRETALEGPDGAVAAGSGKPDDVEPVVRTRNPDIKRLGEVLVNAEGRHVLEQGRGLDTAHASTVSADPRFTALLLRARNAIRDAAGSLRACDGQDQSLLDIADDIKETADMCIPAWRRPGWAAGRSPRRSRAPQAAARRASGG